MPDGIDSEFFKENGNAFRMGNPPLRIEIITEASGIHFDASDAKRVIIEADGVALTFINYEDLVTNKRASGRLRDLARLRGTRGRPTAADSAIRGLCRLRQRRSTHEGQIT